MNPNLHNVADLERIAELEAELAECKATLEASVNTILSGKAYVTGEGGFDEPQTDWQTRAEKAEAELAWWNDHFLTENGDDAPTQIKKLEAELEAFRGKPSGKTTRAGTGIDALEAAQLSRYDLFRRIKDLEAEVERLSLSARKATPKTDDEIEAAAETFKRAFIDGAKASRKEREDG